MLLVIQAPEEPRLGRMSLRIILPTEENLPDSSTENVRDFLARIEAKDCQREVIFFDESLTGYVIYNGDRAGDFSVYLDISIVPEEANRARFSNINSLQRSQTSPTLPMREPEATEQLNSYSILNNTLTENDIIYSGEVLTERLVNGFDGTITGAEISHCIVWRFNIPIVYPRKKFVNPRVKVSCYLNEKDSTSSSAVNDIVDGADDNSLNFAESAALPDYLYADKPNILEELNHGVVQKDDALMDQKFEFFEEKEVRTNPATHSRVGTGSGLDRVEENDVTVPTTSIPSQPVHEQPMHISGLVSLPITVSLVIKLKSTKPAGRNNILLSTLNIEASEEVQKMYTKKDNMYFNILGLNVVFKAGTIEELISNEFPIRFKLEDSLNLTYKLINNDFLDKELKQQDGSGVQFSSTKPVNIKLTLQVQKKCEGKNEFTTISNTIVTSWNPYLDFSIIAPPINSSLKATAPSGSQSGPGGSLGAIPTLGSSGLSLHFQTSPLMQSQATFGAKLPPRKAALLSSAHKQKTSSFVDVNIIPSINNNVPSSNISYSSQSGGTGGGASKVLNSASSVTVNLTTSSSILSGLRLTFIGKLSIQLGQVTTWRLQAINNSTGSLNLSLLVQSPSSQLGSSNNAGAKTYSNSNLLLNYGKTDTPIIYGQGQLQSLYRSLKVVKSGVIVLDNDIRLGPLENNSVFETEIKLIGVSRGVFNLDGIKIFDTNTGDGLDFGKLVEVFVV